MRDRNKTFIQYVDKILNIFSFYGEGFLAPLPTPKLEDHPSERYVGEQI